MTSNGTVHAMRASARCVAEIKQWETLRLDAYDDGYGNWTIGYGRVQGVQPGQKISVETAEAFLQEDVGTAERAVNAGVQVLLTQGQFDACVMFTFNCGGGAFAKSQLLKEINAGRFEEVPAQVMRWAYATDRATGKKVESRGLVRRRRAELALWHGLHEPDREEGLALTPGTVTDQRPGAAETALKESRTIKAALYAFLGSALAFFERGAALLLEGAAEVARLEPIKLLALAAGGNMKAIGFAVTIGGVTMVIVRRLTAATRGKVG